MTIPIDESDLARLRFAEALRPLILLGVSGSVDDDAFREAAEALEAISDRLRPQDTGVRRTRRPPDASRPTTEYFPTSPIAGLINPIAPPVRFEVVPGTDGGYDEIRADAYFDYPYEGPPNCVHGGVIAEAFDEVLGAANMVAGNPGMTGTLTVRYRKPTPLRAHLTLVGRCVGRDGRKVTTWGGIYDGDVLTAEAEGLFITVGPRQMLAIAEQNSASGNDELLEVMRSNVEAWEAEQAASGESGS